ncbi:MAG: glycoside hydrolase [Actinomycetota bacterium]|nr:glycoside hydrolase [Actinomycetota bacterium]
MGSLLAVPLGAGAQGAGSDTRFVVEAPRQVGTDGNPVRLYVQPQVAVHPDDPSLLALAAGEARNGGCALNVSRDGGLSWGLAAPTLMPDELPFCVQRNYGPVLDMAFASDGTLYVGMSGSSYATDPPHPNGPITALIARTNDLGNTHQTFVVAEPDPFTYTPEAPADAPAAGSPPSSAAQPGQPTTTVPELQPTTTIAQPAPEPAATEQTGFEQHRLNSVAVDPNNPEKVYRGWREGIGGLIGVPFGATPVRAMIAVSNDGGETWGDPIDVADRFEGDEEIFGSDVPMLVVDPDGTVFGFAKERPRRAAEGEPTAVSRLFMFKSTDGGENWTTSVFSPGAESLDNPDAAVDPSNGNLYVVYSSRGQDTDEDEPAPASEIYFLASTDGGATWSEPINVTDDDPTKGADQHHPGISVASNGRIDLAWHDFRNDPFFVPGEIGDMGSAVGQRYWDAYYASSTNAGGTWSANTRVTNPSIDGKLGVTFNNNDLRGPMGVASSDNAAYVTWADSRATGADATQAEDAYFSRIRYAGPAELGAGAGEPDKVLWALLGAGAALALGGLGLVAGTRLTRGRGEPGPSRQPAPAARE